MDKHDGGKGPVVDDTARLPVAESAGGIATQATNELFAPRDLVASYVHHLYPALLLSAEH